MPHQEDEIRERTTARTRANITRRVTIRRQGEATKAIRAKMIKEGLDPADDSFGATLKERVEARMKELGDRIEKRIDTRMEGKQSVIDQRVKDRLATVGHAAGTGGGGGGEGGGGGGGGTSGSDPFIPGSFTYPSFVPPDFNTPDFNAPDPFTYAAFNAPEDPFTYADFAYPEFERTTADNFTADPGYAFRQREGARAIQNSAAARGMLHSKNTIASLMGYNQGLASNEFQNVDDRRVRNYGVNRANAADIYGTNRANAAENYDRRFVNAYNTYGTNRAGAADIYDRGYRNQLTEYGLDYGKETDEYNRALDTYRTNFGTAATGYGLNLNRGQLGLGFNRLDFDRDNSRVRNLLDLFRINQPTFPPFNPL